MTHLFVFGLGYSARFIASELRARGWTVAATGSAGDVAFDDDAAVRAAGALGAQVLACRGWMTLADRLTAGG